MALKQTPPRSTTLRPGNGRAPLPKLNLRRSAALDEAFGDGVTGEAGDFVDVQLVHHLLPVFLDGFDADAKFGGDLFVRETFGDQLQYFGFARGQSAVLFLDRSAAG